LAGVSGTRGELRRLDRVRVGLDSRSDSGFTFLRKAAMETSDNRLIVSDPNVMMGKPVVAGTRITVELILEKLAAGETIDDILAAHPRLTRQAISAALAFAAMALRADVIYPLTPAVP